MNSSIYKRVINEANHVIETNNTIRETAKEFNVSKSTVHKDLHERLIKIDRNLYEDVDKCYTKFITSTRCKSIIKNCIKLLEDLFK